MPELDSNTCDRCPAFAPWVVQNLEGFDMEPINRWYACNRHLALVLREADWEMDAVRVQRLDPRDREII